MKSYSFLLKVIEERKTKNKVTEEFNEDFLTWCKRVSPELNFNYKWIKYVVSESGKQPITLLSTPPQIGKTTLFTVHQAAYYLCKYPEKRGIIVMYNFAITSRVHREILSILEKENVSLYSTSKVEIVHSNLIGSISFCGFSSGITSKPADYILIDDPIRSAEDAYSARFQETLWSGFSTSIYARLQRGAELKITHTRWHDNDLIGQIIQKTTNSELKLDYKYINLPAICDEPDDLLGREIGESVCPERYSSEEFRIKMLLAEGDGYALYQGRPAPPDGNLFKQSDIESELFSDITHIPNNTIDFISVDCAFKDTKTSDYVAIGHFKYCISSCKLYLINMINDRLDFTRTTETIRDLFNNNDLHFALVEDKANGTAIINTLSREFPRFIAINPEGGKIARAYAAQPFIKTKRLKVYTAIDNYTPFINQVKSFPKSTHDDMVDVLTQAINYIEDNYSNFDYSKISEGYEQLSQMRF